VTAATTPDPTNLLLRRARFNAGLSLRELAEAAGVSVGTIVRLEKHGGEPQAATAKRVADALDLRPTDLFELPLPEPREVSAA
jgi:transcriptional regulator with XRE-family HTH domain